MASSKLRLPTTVLHEREAARPSSGQCLSVRTSRAVRRHRCLRGRSTWTPHTLNANISNGMPNNRRQPAAFSARLAGVREYDGRPYDGRRGIPT